MKQSHGMVKQMAQKLAKEPIFMLPILKIATAHSHREGVWFI
jgi:hypothetical protein